MPVLETNTATGVRAEATLRLRHRWYGAPRGEDDCDFVDVIGVPAMPELGVLGGCIGTWVKGRDPESVKPRCVGERVVGCWGMPTMDWPIEEVDSGT